MHMLYTVLTYGVNINITHANSNTVCAKGLARLCIRYLSPGVRKLATLDKLFREMTKLLSQED